MKKVSAWAAAHAPAGTRWGRRALSLLLSLVLCLTLLPGAAFAADTDGHWAEKTITDWQQKGYISGYSDGTFRPDSSITRAEFIKILNRVLGLTAEGSISFSDVKESDWFYAEVAKAVAAGYAQGSADGTFRPNAPITRAEAAAMLARAFQLTENEARAEEFADASAIPAWAKGSVGAVAEAGYMTGYPDGSFGASGSITRAEAVVTADRAERAAAEDTKKPTTPGTGSGGTVTPPSSPDQPDQPTTPAIEVAAIGTVADIEVATGTLTDADAAIAALPKQVVMMDSAGSSIKDNGANVLADVTWEFTGCTIKNSTNLTGIATGFKGTLDINETECVNIFTGKVTMPSGYTFTGDASALTITTTITVKKADDETLTTKTINSAVIADISRDLESYVSVDKVVEELESKNLLPTKLSLYYGNQFVATVDIPDSTRWKAEENTTNNRENEGYKKYTLTPEIEWNKITLPAGYQLQSGLGPDCSVYVKNADTSGLEEMIRQLTELKARFTNDELEALENSDKVYQALSKSNPEPEDVAAGVTFVTYDEISALGNAITGANNYITTGPIESQDEVQQKINGLVEAYNAVNTVLSTAKTGTGFTNANIRYNVKQALKTEAAWLTDGQPLKAENSYTLPLTLNDITTDKNDSKSTVTLSWSCKNRNSDTDSNITINSNDGSVTITAPATPQAVTFTAEVTLGEQKIGDISFDATLGAPIARYPNTSGDVYVAIDKLTSGKEQTFWIRIPLWYNNPKIKAIDASQAAAECSDGLLTGSITVNSVRSDAEDQRGDYTVLWAQLTATAKQLDAVLASATSTEGIDYETATVTLKIPYDAVTLTDWAIEQGWYIPKNGLELEAEVNIHHPLVKVTGATLDDSGNNVTVTFDAEHWKTNYSQTVWMALVPSTADTFPSDNTGYVQSTYGEGVNGNGYNYSVDIPASNLTADTTYHVWVKIGDDGKWTKSNTTYTYSTT